MKLHSVALAVVLLAGADLRLGVASRLFGQEQGSPAAMSLWQLPETPPAQGADPAARDGWKPLAAATAAQGLLKGGLAVENPTLVAVVRSGSQEIVLLSKGAGDAGRVRHRLALVGSQGRPAGALGGVRLVEASESEVVVGFAAGQVEAQLRIGIGGPSVEVVPGRGAAAIQLRGSGRFAFVPDFFGNDVLFDAQQVAATRVFAPAENFIVALDDGHASLVMLAWPKDGGDEVLLLAERSGSERRFTTTQVSFDGKSVFVAVLARPGIWCEKDLATVPKDQTVVVDGWRPPFPAKWMTILVQRSVAGAAAGIASETLPVPTLPPAGDQPYSDVYYHPWVPSWFSGSEWRLHLETSRQHMMTHKQIVVPEHLLAINYPRDRVRETPLDALTLVDVMRQSLGAGPCEYILDLEGLNKTRSTGAAGTGKPVAGATCSEHGALVYYYLGERSDYPRRRETLALVDDGLVSVEKIKDFLDAAYARIQEYLAWSDEIVKLTRDAKARDPRTAALADRILPIARGMRELWDTMVQEDKPCAHPLEWRMALDHCKDLIRRESPNFGERICEFDPQMRGAGEEVDGGMQACRLIVKRIRQEAALAGADDPATAKLAAVLRQRCRDILRNKHYKEGDSVRLGGER